MCGRFILSTPADTLQQLFGFVWPGPSWDRSMTDRARFNVAPTQPILVVLAGEPGRRAGAWARWGMLAAHDRLAINARSETVFARPAFRDAVRVARVLVPADGFFEWKKDGARRRPHLIEPLGGGPLALAGVVAEAEIDETRRLTCAILTTAANDEVRPLHDRMPVILEGEAIDRWLDPAIEDRSRLEPLLRSGPSRRLRIREVSSRVNKVENDDPSCLLAPEPVEAGARAESDGPSCLLAPEPVEAGARAESDGPPPASAEKMPSEMLSGQGAKPGGVASASEGASSRGDSTPRRRPRSARKSGSDPRQLGFDFQ